MTDPALLRRLVGATVHAPSVHNVQPARWRIEQDSVLLFEDRSRRLRVGDPRGNDAAISLGASAEAFILAASADGRAVAVERHDLPPPRDVLEPVARLRLSGKREPDPLAAFLSTRESWRGDFQPPMGEDRSSVQRLAADDVTTIVDPSTLKRIGKQFDRASYGYLRHRDYRAEFRGWMRLSKSHPRWSTDGLNAEAMSLSPVEAFAAGQVLGWLFPILDRIGLAPALVSEGKKVAGAAGVLLFHRPVDEDPFDSGRRFLRLWLEIEKIGMGAAVLAALADNRSVAADLASSHSFPKDHRLVSAFRVGRRVGKSYPRARLPVDDLLV